LHQLGLQPLGVVAAGAAQHLEQQAGVDGERDEVVVAALDVQGAGLKQHVLQWERAARVQAT
jgi:hypothetical protein